MSEFGRQNPVAYLEGRLVGFALARFARASTPTLTSASLPAVASSVNRQIDLAVETDPAPACRRPTSPGDQIMADPLERSTPALMGDLLEQVTQLVQKEVQLFRAEMSDKATQAMVAAAVFSARPWLRSRR